jgi:capsular polysaccharide biosynthesis protein
VEPRERIEDFMRRYGRVLAVAVVLVAVSVTWASLMQTPTYEAEAVVLVGERPPAQGPRDGKIQLIPLAPTPETLRTLTQTMVRAIDSRPVAEEVLRRSGLRRSGLRMDPADLLHNLSVEQIEGTQHVRLTYEDSDPMRAKLIVNAIAKETPEISPESGTTFEAIVWKKAEASETPASPHPLRNGLLTLVIGLMLCAGTPVALPAVRARVATLAERPTRRGVGIVERVKEKKLLLAIGRRGKLTVVQASLDTSLSVEESRRMLEELAFAGHLEVTVEDGQLLYSFWRHDAP